MLRNRSLPPYTSAFRPLVVEVDGDEHFTEEGRQKDRRKDASLKNQGYEVIRVAGYDLIDGEVDPLHMIEDAIDRLVAEQNQESTGF